jgi:hypothetical protein
MLAGSRRVRSGSTGNARLSFWGWCAAITLLQINPTAVMALSADLVAWSRLGSQ